MIPPWYMHHVPVFIVWHCPFFGALDTTGLICYEHGFVISVPLFLMKEAKLIVLMHKHISKHIGRDKRKLSSFSHLSVKKYTIYKQCIP